MTASPDDRTEEVADAANAPAKKTPARKPPAKSATTAKPAEKSTAKATKAQTKPVAAASTKSAAEKAAPNADVVSEPTARAGAGAKKSTAAAARTAAARNSAARSTTARTTGAKKTTATAAKKAAGAASSKSATAKSPTAKTSTAKTATAKAAAAKTAAASSAARTSTSKAGSARTAAAKTAAARTAAAKRAAAAEAAEDEKGVVTEPASDTALTPVSTDASVPVDETPAVPEAVDEAPIAPAAVDETPVDEAPFDETPVDETPVNETPVDETPVDEAPVDDASLDGASTDERAVDAPEEPRSEDAAELDGDELDGDEPGGDEPGVDSDGGAAASATEAITIRGLVKTFGDHTAVAGIDLTVPAGSFYGIVGPNGAGKTTTLSIVAGLLRADAGSVVICGIDQAAKPLAAKRVMGVLPDRLRTFDRLTGRQLLYYYGLLRGLASDVIEKRVSDLARAFDLGEALSRVVSDYSAGMTKKIMLAGAMIHSPRVLVLDEPFEAVDPVSSAVILDILRAYVSHGGTVILSSHGMDLVERVCSRVAIIVGGEVLAEGTIDEVRAGQTLEARFVELSGGTGEVEGLEWLHTFSD